MLNVYIIKDIYIYTYLTIFINVPNWLHRYFNIAEFAVSVTVENEPSPGPYICFASSIAMQAVIFSPGRCSAMINTFGSICCCDAAVWVCGAERDFNTKFN